MNESKLFALCLALLFLLLILLVGALMFFISRCDQEQEYFRTPPAFEPLAPSDATEGEMYAEQRRSIDL